MDFEVFKYLFINKACFSDPFYANLMAHALGMSTKNDHNCNKLSALF